MSLLMDALKKAEKDKKKAADETRPEVSVQAPAPSDLELTTMGPVAGGVAPTELPAQGGLRLAPLPRGTSPGGYGRVAGEALVAGETTGGGVDPDLTRFSAEGEIGTIGLWGATLETRESAAGVDVTPALDRESTLPSQRALNASLKDYFESSQSGERSSAAGAARKASGPRTFRVGDPVSRVSADTVFSASRRSSLSKTVSAGLGVVLVLGASLAGLWVWSELDPGAGLGAGLPPLAALPRVPPPSDTAVAGSDGPAPAPADSGPVVSAPSAPAAATPQTHPTDAPGHLAELPAIDMPALEPDAFSAAAPLSSPALKHAPTSEVSPSELDPEATRRTATAQDDSTAPRESFPPEATGAVRSALPNAPPSAIRIQRSPPRDRLDPDLSEAYRAFQSGNPSRAETLYRRVQAREPDRRDALLGLAAVAMRQGRTQEAYGYYRRLIELDPRDSVAFAGIASLTGSGAREANESRLKLLLAEAPDAAHLNFALGNLYAKQGRWAEAQAAYFKAYTSDSENPDYSFNLAVSLDRLGQGRAALGYYRRALDATDRGVKGFDTAQVLTRIQALSSQSSKP